MPLGAEPPLDQNKHYSGFLMGIKCFLMDIKYHKLLRVEFESSMCSKEKVLSALKPRLHKEESAPGSEPSSLVID